METFRVEVFAETATERLENRSVGIFAEKIDMETSFVETFSEKILVSLQQSE